MKTMRRVLAGIGVILMLALAQTASAISATGGDVATVGGCTYHTFTNNGTFTVTAGGNAQVLVVGGGGGGGASGGGGGAGGVRNYELVNLTPGDYTITVGTGGAGGITNGGEHYGATGDNSVFSGESISLTGGGGGGGAVYLDFDGEGALVVGEGLPGGSGGGGRGYSEAPGGLETGAGTGNNGGAASAPGTGSPNYGSGGGGGYAAAGVAGSSTAGGNGGAGLTLDSFTAQLSAFSAMTVIASGGGGGCYWGGGDVGTAGMGGTGAGNGSASDAQAGGNAVSFGSGGGGGGQGPALATGGNGAAGVVVVRYPPPSSLIRLVNIDFDHDLGYGFRTYDGPGALTNAAGVPRGGTYWNSAVEGTLVDPVKESDGITPSTVSVAFTGVNHYNVRNQPKSCQFGAALLDDFVYAGSGTAGFTISGLNDALTYDLYVYSQNGFYGNESPRFVVGSLTNDIVNAGDVTGFGLNINYAVFRNLTPAGGAISGTFESAGACPLNGLQIVEQSGGIKGTLIIIQ